MNYDQMHYTILVIVVTLLGKIVRDEIQSRKVKQDVEKENGSHDSQLTRIEEEVRAVTDRQKIIQATLDKIWDHTLLER